MISEDRKNISSGIKRRKGTKAQERNGAKDEKDCHALLLAFAKASAWALGLAMTVS